MLAVRIELVFVCLFISGLFQSCCFQHQFIFVSCDSCIFHSWLDYFYFRITLKFLLLFSWFLPLLNCLRREKQRHLLSPAQVLGLLPLLLLCLQNDMILLLCSLFHCSNLQFGLGQQLVSGLPNLLALLHQLPALISSYGFWLLLHISKGLPKPLCAHTGMAQKTNTWTTISKSSCWEPQLFLPMVI